MTSITFPFFYDLGLLGTTLLDPVQGVPIDACGDTQTAWQQTVFNGTHVGGFRTNTVTDLALRVEFDLG